MVLLSLPEHPYGWSRMGTWGTASRSLEMSVVSAMTFLQPLFGKSAFSWCQITVIQRDSNRHVKGGQRLGAFKEEIFVRVLAVCLGWQGQTSYGWVGLTCLSKACKTKSSVGHPAVLHTSTAPVAVCHLKIKIAAKLLKLNVINYTHVWSWDSACSKSQGR